MNDLNQNKNWKMEIVKPIRILHLEDSPADAQLVQALLKKAKVEFEYFFADN